VKRKMANREEKNKFSMMIMTMAIDEQIDHLDAITTFCERNSLEVEVAATMVNDSLKSIIEGEAMELRFLPRGSRLPV